MNPEVGVCLASRPLAGARAAGTRVVGKANLNALAFGASGVNEYTGGSIRIPAARVGRIRPAGVDVDPVIDAALDAVSNRVLLADPARRDLPGPRVRASLADAQAVTPAQLLQVAGFPALTLPVPSGRRLPASLQLIGGPNAEGYSFLLLVSQGSDVGALG